MTKKKILFIYGPLNAGGAERVLLDYLQNLDRSKYELELCLIVNGGTLLHEVPNDIPVFSLFPSYNLHYKIAYRLSIWMGNDWGFTNVIKKKIVNKYDVIISFLEGIPLKVHTLIKSEAKNITWVHVDLDKFRYTEKSFYRKNEQQAYEKMDKIICVSNDTKKAFLNRFSNLKTKTSVIYNPVDTNKIKLKASDLSLEHNNFTIVLVGRLTKQKSIERFILLAERFKHFHLKIDFQIVGEGELKNDLVNLSQELQVAHMISFIGYQPNPYPFIKNADLLVSTSSYEGFGLVLCEAMVLGVPVVSTKTAGPIEIIGDNQYGWLCDHTIESLYETVKLLLEDDSLRQELIKNGFERVNDFSIDKALHLFNQLVEEN